ncbi:CvpA family protein [Hirschia baltica]|uniref:Colicin V production protein n=1 Tax=Hirschia baltica (strain ATCC 49814 / DSM 5838 / IFAM 1418) TaxID=582402 RepID=C6XKR6_HIRBI|nr:CvpA family protein [Hirschia baltica]ACT59633.1 Colicin V production protein [Hirschia baltica ATCC 49814]
MEEFAGSQITAFDVIVVAIIVVSAIMSLSRGLVREASSILSFIAGGIAALFLVKFFGEPARALVPGDWPKVTADIILGVIGFVGVYIAAGWFGSQLAKLIHTSPQIGSLDRIAGAIFGAARGMLAIVLFVLLMHMMIPKDNTPALIANSKLYPYADNAATWFSENFPGFVQQAKDAAEDF